MELILGKECEPVDTLLLVLAKLRLDSDWDFVLLHLVAVQELHQELALLVTALEQILGEVRRIRKASLQRTSTDRNREATVTITSRGTILTRDANVFVAVARTSSSGSLIRPRTGTTMKMTYGRALMSNFWTMSNAHCEPLQQGYGYANTHGISAQLLPGGSPGRRCHRDMARPSR